MELLKRSFEVTSVDDEEMVVEGYALTFDTKTKIGSGSWGFTESINRNSLESTNLNDVVFNMNHDNSKVFARTKNDTLSLEVDGVGLKIRAKIIDIQEGRDLYKRIKEGLISQMSFAGYVEKSAWDDDFTEREILSFSSLIDVSAVTFPAYESTTISARDNEKTRAIAEKQFEKIRKLEELLNE